MQKEEQEVKESSPQDERPRPRLEDKKTYAEKGQRRTGAKE